MFVWNIHGANFMALIKQAAVPPSGGDRKGRSLKPQFPCTFQVHLETRGLFLKKRKTGDFLKITNRFLKTVIVQNVYFVCVEIKSIDMLFKPCLTVQNGGSETTNLSHKMSLTKVPEKQIVQRR